MKKKLMLLLTCLLIGIGLVSAQTQRVTGTVTSEEDGQPIIGASVLVKGTNVGTITDVNGKFTLSNVPASARTLVVSFVGMRTQEVAIAPNLQIVLKTNAEVLDEVMVVAYGTTTKASFTGSASVMRNEDMSAQKQSLVKSLEGKMAGVRVGSSTGDPGADQRIQVRGIGSISASSQPLYVVDGVPIVNADATSGLKSQSLLASLNPDDIESMTVLKDAAAASLYGSRAANGVIIITTKKGKEGKTRISYDGEFGWAEIAVKDAIEPMSASELKDYYFEALKNYRIIRGKKTEAEAIQFAQDNIGDFFWNYDSTNDTDWSKEVYRSGFSTNHQVALSGGSDKTKFYTSFGYNKVNGTVKGSMFERYSGRVNLDQQINDWLKIGVKQMISYTNTEGHRDQNEQAQGFATTTALSILYSLDPTATVTLPDGSYNPNVSFGKNSNPNLMLGSSTGPYAETIDSKMMRSMTNVEGEIKLPYNFTLRSIFGYDYMDNKEREFWAPQSVNGASYNGLGERWSYTNKTLTSSTTLNYANSFGLHNLNALAGFEVEDRNRLYIFAASKNYSTNKLPELSNGQAYDDASSTLESSIMSYLGNVNYNYDNRYYLSASFRRDGSSRLAADNRWANFWSVSGSWRISSEKFMQENPLFSDLKLRASYGTNGNLPVDYFGYMPTYTTAAGYGTAGALFWIQRDNSTLTWEKSKNFNVGIDWTLYNRVSLTVEYYNKLTTDLLFQTPTSYVTGFKNQWENLGKLTNSGIEFTVSSQNIQAKDFTWTTDFNLTKQKIEVTELPDGSDVQYGDGNMYLLREGESMHTFFLPQHKGVNPETGLMEFWIDPNDESKGVTEYYSRAGKTIVGKAVPDWLGGITNRFTYKNFDLSFMISYQFGADMFDYPGYFLTYSDGVRVGSFNMNKSVAGKYWKKAGDQTEFPRPIYGNPYRSDKFSSREIHSTDNIRVRDITFGYRVPISKSIVNNLRLYFRASNPFLIYNATKGVDPDVDVNGYRQTDTPPTRSFVFGLNFEL